ncbi:MAG: acyl carrier protein [Sulfuricaulis sp.]
MLENIIKNYLINSAGVDPTKFDRPDLKVEDLGLDSLGLIEMLFEVEDRFGFQIVEPARFQSMNFKEMVVDIEDTIRKRHNGQLPSIDLY